MVKLVETNRYFLFIRDINLKNKLFPRLRSNWDRHWHIVLFIETYNNMLEMRKYILLFYLNLSSSTLSITLEIIVYIRTNYSIFVSINRLKIKDLSASEILQSTASDQCYPVSFADCRRQDSFH